MDGSGPSRDARPDRRGDGATSGIGLITARALSRVGAHVVLAVRNVDKGHAAARSMGDDTDVMPLDVSDQKSVRAFAGNWRGGLDVLINNAGIMQVPLSRTTEGYEMQLATNYLGHFTLTNLLIPHIKDRVVTLSSQLHRRGRLDLEDLQWTRRTYDRTAAYCDSKLADLLFAIELQRRLAAAGSRIRSIAAHPGIATTTLAGFNRRMSGSLLGRVFLNDPEHGALPTLYAASQDVAGGSYVGPDGIGGIKGHPKIGTPSRTARDADLAGRLWDATAELTGVGRSAQDEVGDTGVSAGERAGGGTGCAGLAEDVDGGGDAAVSPAVTGDPL
ncbi:oxidoreductase [Streptomyces cacaoi]|uniref:oxidoreductase n=1 Tax=Streptomyces cacaoi TaxID=1898 RepID=UPI003749DE0C